MEDIQQTVCKESMKASKLKKLACFLKKKKTTLDFQKKMLLNRSEFLEQIIIDTFCLNYPNLRKLEQKLKISTSLGNLRKSITFFETFTI